MLQDLPWPSLLQLLYVPVCLISFLNLAINCLPLQPSDILSAYLGKPLSLLSFKMSSFIAAFKESLHSLTQQLDDSAIFTYNLLSLFLQKWKCCSLLIFSLTSCWPILDHFSSHSLYFLKDHCVLEIQRPEDRHYPGREHTEVLTQW